MKPSEVNKPHLVITVGIPRAGKSFFAENFAKTFNSPIVSYKQFLQVITNGNTDRTQANSNASELTSIVLDQVLKTKQTIVYDGPSGQRSERSAISKKARDAGYTPLFVWVQTDQTTAKKRAISRDRQSSESFTSDLKRFSPPHAIEKAVVISGKHTYSSQLKLILAYLAKTGDKLDDTKPKNRKILIR